MKNLKLPVDTKINCECGCEFEFTVFDTIQQGYACFDGSMYSKIVIDCPFCKKRHILQEGNIPSTEADDE